MKNLFKKLTIVICAVSASLMLAAAPALATSEGFRSGPNESAVTTDTAAATTGDASTGTQAAAETTTVSTADNAANSVTAQTAGSKANKKYLSKLGGFLWFLLSIIVNSAISYWLGSRFYRMAKKSAQGSTEIRALRKDIEEKFASTLKDINEPAIDVINRNENYARDDEGLVMPQRRSHVELDEDEQEMIKRWDSHRSTAKSGSANRDEDEYDRRKQTRSAYQPTRKSSGIEFEEDDEEESSENREKPAGRFANAKNKTKDFLSNVFPFDE